MPRHLSSREIALVLVPSLLLGGFAWYQHRIEQISGPGAHGIFISNFEVVPETKGLYQSRGITHHIVFTVDHPWPRPRWWGMQDASKGVCRVLRDPLQPNGDKLTRSRPSSLAFDPENTILFGGAVTTANGSTLHTWSHPDFAGTFENGHYVFDFKTNLTKIPLEAGAVTYHGLCRIAGDKSLRVDRVIREVGQKTQAIAKDTAGATLSVTAKPFMTFSNSPDSECEVNFLISHPVTENGKGISVEDYDYYITDAKGKRMKIENIDGKPIIYGGGQTSQVSPTQSKYYIGISITPLCTSPEPLTLSGKISVNEHWPIPFSVRLPKR